MLNMCFLAQPAFCCQKPIYKLLATETASVLSFMFSTDTKPQNHVFCVATKAQTSQQLNSFHTSALFIGT